MSARDVIMDCGPVGCCVIAPEKADEILEVLTAAGYRIVGPDEVDPLTVERCAQIAEAERRSDLAVEAGYTPVWQRHARNIAAAIRAIASGGKQ